MNDDIKRLRNLIDTYKLSRPVSPELQQYVIYNRMPDLRQILMKSAKYSLISWFVIMIYSLFRKYGLHVTLIQSKIIAGITAAAVASGSAAVAYRGAKYISNATVRSVPKIEDTIDKAEPDGEKKTEKTLPGAPIEKSRIQEKQPIPVYKERIAPAEKKLPDKRQQKKVNKKKGTEYDTVSDIPSL